MQEMREIYRRVQKEGCEEVNDEILLGIISIPCIVVSYGIYCSANPGTDGAVFGTVLTAIGGIIGYIIGSRRGYNKALKVMRND